MTGNWTERGFGISGRGRSLPRTAPRSLGAALREAGLGDAAPDPHDDEADASPIRASLHPAASAIGEPRSPRLAYYTEADVSHSGPIVSPAHEQHGVVSPPPWLRAKRRGRWQARMLNATGWMIMIVVAGTIIGVAGRYLAVPPLGAGTMQARQ